MKIIQLKMTDEQLKLIKMGLVALQWDSAFLSKEELILINYMVDYIENVEKELEEQDD